MPRPTPEEMQRRIQQKLDTLQHVQQLRAMLAQPSGHRAAAELFETFILDKPRGTSDLEIGMWIGAGLVARWFVDPWARAKLGIAPTLVEAPSTTERTDGHG